jgi:hypothetical protein
MPYAARKEKIDIQTNPRIMTPSMIFTEVQEMK